MAAINSSPPESAPRTAEAWAWLDGGKAGRFSAAGEFVCSASPPPGEIAFYVNDFELSDAAPWRVPVDAAGPKPVDSDVPGVRWEPPSRDGFREVFDDLMDAVRDREILKAVPVAVAAGRRVSGGDIGSWMRRVLTRPDMEIPGHSFGWMEAGAGFGGFTPEILFQIDGCRLTTMALAGTTDAAHAADLTERPKLAREHAVVVDELQKRLAVLGKVVTGRRDVVQLGTMRHLRTPMEVTLPSPPGGDELNQMIRLLHPTPALGISPRTESSAALLARCRARMGTPAAFGAPFGVAWPGGALVVVAIRGVFWKGENVALPSGCGLVAGSEFDAEWEELELKRA
ncbi:MAG TPA: chorismate-binding protein, partial [Verrucomicrobiales bacterium]|nr:chorismate-binding protein [Verrucomicrobiales bacterium]